MGKKTESITGGMGHLLEEKISCQREKGEWKRQRAKIIGKNDGGKKSRKDIRWEGWTKVQTKNAEGGTAALTLIGEKTRSVVWERSKTRTGEVGGARETPAQRENV